VATCPDCDVAEGRIHELGCDMELCPFCGCRLISCLTAKGRVPWIEYPVICAKCAIRYPEFFRVSDEEWAKYIQIDKRQKVICRTCFDYIKRLSKRRET
jgi:hypothetical protein